jgi:nucleotide-binding universal stress UspA family protein
MEVAYMSGRHTSTDPAPAANTGHRQQSVTKARSLRSDAEEQSRLDIGRLLIAVDLSPESEKVIGVARRLALATGAQVFVVHCAEPDPDLVGYDRDEVAERFHYDHAAVQDCAEQLRAEGVDATALMIHGPIVETMLNEAERLKPELLIVGSHCRGVVYDMLLGSDSANIVRQTEIPVLLVPTRRE